MKAAWNSELSNKTGDLTVNYLIKQVIFLLLGIIYVPPIILDS